MLETLPMVPGLTELVLVLLLVGVVSAGFTELLKLVLKLIRKKWNKKEKPPWWALVLQLVSTGIGALSGPLFFPWPWGVFIGLSAGLLSTIIYAKAKKLIKNMQVPTNTPPIPDFPSDLDDMSGEDD